MGYYVSRYTHLFSHQGQHYLFAIRTTDLASITPALYSLLQEAKETNSPIDAPQEFLESLREVTAVGYKGEDDIYVREHMLGTMQRCFNQSILSLVIAPTTKCNFRCGYCFEPHKDHRVMDDRVEDALFQFTEQHAPHKRVSLLWYGGEPLLAVDRIESMLRRFEKESYSIYDHTIITNGYYLDDRVIDLFKEYPLKTVQITFDGDKTRHDGIRKDYRTGEPSYDRILANLIRAQRALPDTLFSIRVNIDARNQAEFPKIQYELLETLGGDNIDVYPGYIRTDSDDGKSLGGHAMEREDIASFISHSIDCGGCGGKFYPQLGQKGCSANSISSFVVGPSGELYKCWNDVTDPEKVVGTIFSPEVTNRQLHADYAISSLWYENPECRTCKLLPVCDGGCPYYAIRNLRQGAHYNMCSPFKDEHFFEECILSGLLAKK
jgi:radical SAM additional 4Fe4S-binding domain